MSFDEYVVQLKMTSLSSSSHIQSVLIGVKYQNCRQTLEVYLLFAILLGQIKLQICKSVLIEFAPSESK